MSIVAIAALLPAAAAAQTAISPPGGDNYLGPIFLNDQTHPFPSQAIGFTADTTNYTTQADLFNPPGSGGGAEPTSCGSSVFANTIWSVFHSDRFGLMDISTAGPFDSVIGVVPFQDPNHPAPHFSDGTCVDSLSGFQEELKGIVVPNQWYAVQVGGTGTPAGGQLQVKFTLSRPPSVTGDAVLTWRTGSGGANLTSLVVSKVAKGETVQVTCSHHGCGKNPKRVHGKTLLLRPIGQVGPGAPAMKGAAGSYLPSPGATFKPLVHAAAKTFKFLKGRKAKSGTTIEVKILEPGFIGEDFTWKVKGNGVGSKLIRCINAGSTKPRKGSCH
jgi:hypothetical protein